MKRKFLSILSVILLLCQFPCCVLAAEENAAKIRSGYWADDVLYTFVNFPQEEPEKLEVSLFVNNHQQGRGAKPELFSSTGATVHYMLLVDTSSSMSELAYLLSAFAKSLLEYGSNLDISMTNQNQQVTSLPIDRKMLLSIREAAEYSNIGINKIDELLKQPNCPFVLYVGTKKLVKHRAFEEYIEGRVAI